MGRVVAVLAAAAAMVTALAAGTASADVHGISQAGCAPDGVPSGATTQASRDAPGRPDAPIPVSASPFELANFPGEGGHAPAQGRNC
jgi:hypothetical protein